MQHTTSPRHDSFDEKEQGMGKKTVFYVIPLKSVKTRRRISGTRYIKNGGKFEGILKRDRIRYHAAAAKRVAGDCLKSRARLRPSASRSRSSRCFNLLLRTSPGGVAVIPLSTYLHYPASERNGSYAPRNETRRPSNGE